MRDISNLNGEEQESLPAYHERIKIDLAAIMLKRMVEDVSSVKQRAEFMNACVAAAATLAAGQSVFLAGQCPEKSKRLAILDTGRDNAINMIKEAYDAYIAAVEFPPTK